ncbi:MAG: SPFH domain-containing protein [Planctomycetes bacterium]|nr:SPFH domain-containing protein [Planctomycetota bacterium]
METRMTATRSRETPYPRSLPGVPMLLLGVALLPVAAWTFVRAADAHDLGRPVWPWVVAGIVLVLGAILELCGLVLVEPNQSRAVLLFGRYKGTIRRDGFHWVNPFTVRRAVSLRVHNFDSEKLKVNDRAGNPIEINAVVVWRVKDTAQALFDVEDYRDYVRVQSEAGLRTLAASHPYDADDAKPGETSLRGSADVVSRELATELDARLERAGIEVLECRLAHLAYAPEIASAMLQRQQADAIIAARQKIVDGAVGMVQMALEQLSRSNVVELDDERRAAMVQNLLVVLCSERGTQPVVNTGTLYQ